MMATASTAKQQQRQSKEAAATATKTQLDSHAAWQATLDASIACVQQLLTPSQANSKAWRAVSPNQNSTNASISSVSNIDSILASAPSTSQNRLDSALVSVPTPASVQVHRRPAAKSSKIDAAKPVNGSSATLLPPGSSQTGDIYRAVCHVPLGKQSTHDDFYWKDVQDAFRRFLATPECRPLWDHMVDDSEVIEELDATTRICRTVFRLGWPASQRDAITISRSIRDGQTFLDVSTSLPRSPDAPAYLRPAPPYVRSHVNLFAWCFQKTPESLLKVTLFWSWDLKGAWLGMPAGGLAAQLPHILTSLVSHVAKDSTRVPYLVDFGRNVEITSRRFDSTRDMLSIDYQVICEQDSRSSSDGEEEEMSWELPSAEGWDVHIEERSMSGSSTADYASEIWSIKATRAKRGEDLKSGSVHLRLKHDEEHTRAELEQGIRGKVTIQRIAASQDIRLRVNDQPFVIEDVEAEEQSEHQTDSILMNNKSTALLIDDSASVSGFSFRSDVSSQSDAPTIAADEIIKRTGTPGSLSDRLASAVADKRTPIHLNGKSASHFDRTNALATLIRRNYIYFTSLLQEPEAKWKAYSDSKGVTITQLDSIDPTLVVYRAEATFVGVSVWDIFATLGNPGAKAAWDRAAEETSLVEDLGDASKLWWTKMKAAWPVSPRDNVTVETTYKSPASIHVFSFSTDDRGVFPSLPRLELGSIRTQIDLRGWSIESLNPTTVHITMIEQSDPKGWTSKSAATPAAMTTAVAGVGDFAIKQGGPPIVTRLLGGKTRLNRYDHEKGTMRVEYELASSTADLQETTEIGHVECEIRCDLETWCQGLDLVVDPPPINISCLRRHKLSQGGSGLWLTIEHVAVSLEDDLARVTVRKASNGKEKGSVFVNGARIRVDVDEMKEEELALLKDKKRSKPKRIPLDLINMSPKMASSKRNVGGATSTGSEIIESSPLISTSGPISRAGTPSLAVGSHGALNQAINETNDVFSDEKPRQPMTCALDVLFLLRRIHAERSPDPAGNPAGWSLVSQRNGLFIRKRMMQSMSATIHIQRGDKVVEGLTAEDILTAVSSMKCRKLWDEKVDNSMLLESYGNGATTGFFTTKASFPFRGRAFHLASLAARSGSSSTNLGNSSTGTPTVYFYASASFPDRNSSFATSKLNPQALPLGKVLIDGWILETLDPYSSTLNYQIPSTRCTHVVAIDYAGSLPIAVNTMWNANLPRSIVAVEEYIKSKGSLPTIRSPPYCVEVLGDGRDEDRNLIWSFEDDRTKRSSTLLTATFNPLDKVYEVLVKVDARKDTQQTTRSTILAPNPRRPAALNASTTKSVAALAALTGSSDGIDDTTPITDQQSKETEQETMPRAVSSSSIRSLASKSRPSLPRTLMKKQPIDMMVMDVEVELRHYDRGYEVVVSSESIAKADEVPEEALSLRAAPETSRVLPLAIACFDLPPSAVLAATLDPSARPRKHLLRVTLPTATLSEEHQETTSDQVDSPQWYRDLVEKGVCIRLTVKPLHKVDGTVSQDGNADSSNATPNSEIDSQQVPVFYQDGKLQVTHVNQTSAMLQRESEKVEEYARLKRVTPSQSLRVEAEGDKMDTILDDRLPALLQRPIAAVKEYQKAVEDSSRQGLMEPNETISIATSSTEIPDPSTSIGNKATEESNLITNTLPISASTPIMGLLNAYPLSRLGTSTAVSTAVANGGVFSKVPSNGLKDRLQNGSTKEVSTKDTIGKEANAMQKSTSKDATNADSPSEGISSTVKTVMESAGMPGNLVATTEEIRKRLSDVRFSLSTLILVAIIAFLFGSLVRSLLEPADFILVNKTLDELTRSSSSGVGSGDNSIQEAAKNEMKRLLQGHTSINTPTVVKRELKRFVELHLIGGRWDLLIAAARR